MAEEPVLDRQIVSSLLGPVYTPFATEEQLHLWHTDRSQTFDMPFLRIWDQYSGSQPNQENFMMSRAPHQRLDNFESRKTSLTTHLDHKCWSPTPYVSFTNSAAEVQVLADMRFEKRGTQTLTVIDPDTRLRNGLPILDIPAEMDHYNIPNPYRESNKYYNGHYVCLWQVTEREVVGHWQWNDLVTYKDWYQAIILPAFWQFRKKMASQDESFGLWATLNQLSRRFLICHSIIKLIEPVTSDPSDLTNFFDYDDDADTSSEGLTYSFEGELGWDTDEEVEEANRADDMIKISEGDW